MALEGKTDVFSRTDLEIISEARSNPNWVRRKHDYKVYTSICMRHKWSVSETGNSIPYILLILVQIKRAQFIFGKDMKISLFTSLWIFAVYLKNLHGFITMRSPILAIWWSISLFTSVSILCVLKCKIHKIFQLEPFYLWRCHYGTILIVTIRSRRLNHMSLSPYSCTTSDHGP